MVKKASVLVSVLGVAVCAAALVALLGSSERSARSGDDERPASTRSSASGSGFLIGVGIHDVTGPAAQVNMMGYANMQQTTAGIHLRLRSRAFVVVDQTTSKRFAFVSVDGGMAGQLMTTKVVQNLNKQFPGMYSEENVCISGTHSHSGQAGFLQYTLFQITSLGYVKEAADAFVDGITASVVQAHNSTVPAEMLVATGMLNNTNINRSPTAYVLNPREEREQYMSVGNDTDHRMVLLKMVDAASGNALGMLNWFAVHGTSMNNTNRLLSGDNKGYASYLFEKAVNPNGTLPGKGKVVGAFAQTNLGDVSPNTRGPHCLDTGLPCDTLHSTCNGRNELCVASGPGKDMFDSTRIIGKQQFDKALGLFQSASTKVQGVVDYRHQFVHMPSLFVRKVNKTLCSPAMGYAFAAGTTDGPGAFNFEQNTTTSNPFWDLVSHVLAKPSAATVQCHHPKPILLDTGDVTEPYEWDPAIVPVQILRVGQVVILAVPGEFTTMAGRRMRNAVRTTLQAKGALGADGEVVIAGLSNTYASYITTYEEYQQQRYEGGSTIYGPHTLDGYIQVMVDLAEAMADGKQVDPGPTPPNLESSQISLLPGVIVDGVPTGSNFGDVVTDAQSTYSRGDTVVVKFRTGNPRNNLRTEGSFLAIQRLANTTTTWVGTAPLCRSSPSDCAGVGMAFAKEHRSGDGLPCLAGQKVLCTKDSWETVAVDGDWDTRYHWISSSSLSDRSYAEITWDIPATAIPGTYRVQHYGDRKHFLGHVESFTGTSSSFTVR